jgi:hypothetical protein
MSDLTGQPQPQGPSDQGELDEQRQEHLAALGKNAEALPDMADLRTGGTLRKRVAAPNRWRSVNSDGRGSVGPAISTT